MRRPLPPVMRLELGALGRGHVCGDELLLRDWRTRHALPVAGLARFVSSTNHQPRTAHSPRAA